MVERVKKKKRSKYEYGEMKKRDKIVKKINKTKKYPKVEQNGKT